MTGVLQATFMNQRSFGAPPGQQAYTTAGSYTWIAPSGVTSVSIVAVGAGGGSVAGGDSYFVSTATVKGGGGGAGPAYPGNTTGGSFTGDGGGSGGSAYGGVNNQGGGGGAGGYNGGGLFVSGRGGASQCGKTPNAGTNGGGGGGNICACANIPAGAGGGVGILGQGTSGCAGFSCNPIFYSGKGGSGGTNGGSGSFDRFGGAYGGGAGTKAGAGRAGGGGGGLGYKNNYSVNPGCSYTVVVGSAAAANGNYYISGVGAVRIIWPGTTRSFPSTCTGDK